MFHLCVLRRASASSTEWARSCHSQERRHTQTGCCQGVADTRYMFPKRLACWAEQSNFDTIISAARSRKVYVGAAARLLHWLFKACSTRSLSFFECRLVRTNVVASDDSLPFNCGKFAVSTNVSVFLSTTDSLARTTSRARRARNGGAFIEKD